MKQTLISMPLLCLAIAGGCDLSNEVMPAPRSDAAVQDASMPGLPGSDAGAGSDAGRHASADNDAGQTPSALDASTNMDASAIVDASASEDAGTQDAEVIHADAAVNPAHPDEGPDFAPPLRNSADGCTHRNVVIPDPGEENEFAAARLIPAATPYAVERIQYVLRGKLPWAKGCKSGLAHIVRLFRVHGAPEASPELIQEISVPEVHSNVIERVVDLPLQDVITLAAGDQLLVAVSMAGKTPDVMCIGVCLEQWHKERNYWGYSVAPPYVWATLASLGLHSDYEIGAVGHVVQ